MLGNAIGNSIVNKMQAGAASKQKASDNELQDVQSDEVSASKSSSDALSKLTGAERKERIQKALPDARAKIGEASKSDNLTDAEKADLQKSFSLLNGDMKKEIDYKIEGKRAGPGQQQTVGGQITKDGNITIKLNPYADKFFNADGTVDVGMLASTLVHEGRHAYDNEVYGLKNGPATIEEVRRTERNAYRTEAAFLKAVGSSDVLIRDNVNYRLSKDVPLTVDNANVAAEASVKSVVEKRAESVKDMNKAIDRRNSDAVKEAAAYNKKYGTQVSPSLQPRLNVPVYESPKSY